MRKIYVRENKLFKESSVDQYVDHLLSLRIKYLGTRQDCLDWIVYSPYFLVDDLVFDLDPIIISYGLAKTDGGELVYSTDQSDPNLFKWFDSVKAI